MEPLVPDPSNRSCPSFKERYVLKGFASVLATSAILALAACSSSSGASAPVGSSSPAVKDLGSLTLTTQAWLGYGPLFVADKKGYCEVSCTTGQLCLT